MKAAILRADLFVFTTLEFIFFSVVPNRMSECKGNSSDGSDDDEFVDAQDSFVESVSAVEEVQDGEEESDELDTSEGFQDVPSLEEGLKTATESLNLFLANKFDKAVKRSAAGRENSMYHSISYSTITSLQAMMTLCATDVQAALEAAKKSVNVSKRFRRKQSVLAWKKQPYTQEELHAELIFAEGLLLHAVLTFLEDENLVSFVKAALKIRRCYLAYQECHKLIGKVKFSSEKEKAHFESGVRLGYGVFNVLLSMLPPRIMNLLEFVGFSGNREVGFKELDIGLNIEDGLRTPICWLAVLSYDLVAVYAFGLTDKDLRRSEQILQRALAKYPDSVMFLFFRAKYEQVCGRFYSAIEYYEKAIQCQAQWEQFHHLVCIILIFFTRLFYALFVLVFLGRNGDSFHVV